MHDADVHVRLAALSVLSRLRDAIGAGGENHARMHEDPIRMRACGAPAASALGNIHGANADATAALASAAADSGDESLARAARGALDPAG